MWVQKLKVTLTRCGRYDHLRDADESENFQAHVFQIHSYHGTRAPAWFPITLAKRRYRTLNHSGQGRLERRWTRRLNPEVEAKS
jgi:hypothetical protein